MKYVISIAFFLIIGLIGRCQYDNADKVMLFSDATAFVPGATWSDEQKQPINAHGGGMLFHNGIYYWFGENRAKAKSQGVNVYSSTNLLQWKFEGLAFSPEPNDTLSDIATGCLMERPKVIYNEKSKQFVMWFHLELRKQGYKAARAAVAVSNNVTGPFEFVQSFRPNGNMSRDMTIYQDENKNAYLIYSSRENKDLRMAKLADDYLSITTMDTLLFSESREAPAMMKYRGKYFLLSSACTGWAPNEARLHWSKNIWGPWERSSINPMRGKDALLTYGGQSNYILPVSGKKNTFIFMADRWNPKNLIDSRYLWLPIRFEDKMPYVDWMQQWELQ